MTGRGDLLLSEAVAERFASELATVAPGLGLLRLREPMPDDVLHGVVAAYFSDDCYPEHALGFFDAALRAPRLRWLHTFSAGVDHPVFAEVADRGATVTTSSGASASSIGEMVLLYLLAWSRDSVHARGPEGSTVELAPHS